MHVTHVAQQEHARDTKSKAHRDPAGGATSPLRKSTHLSE